VGALSPRRAVGLIALGRIGLGAAVLAAPEKVTSRWLGEDNAALPAVGDLARGLAARDIALGAATLLTLDDPVVGPRVQAGCALADGADVLGTIIARRHLPTKGMLGTVAIAGISTAVGLWLAHRLAHD
jgi:hypothetical protein